MEYNNLIKAIENAGYKARSYSGRGMYGRECVGVYLEEKISLFKFGIKLAQGFINKIHLNDLEDLIVLKDNMGEGIIVYFPEFEWEDEKDLED